MITGNPNAKKVEGSWFCWKAVEIIEFGKMQKSLGYYEIDPNIYPVCFQKN